MSRYAAAIPGVTEALQRLLAQGTITSLRMNFADGRTFPDVPEVTVTMPDAADLARTLELIDQAVRPLGSTMVIWDRDVPEDGS